MPQMSSKVLQAKTAHSQQRPAAGPNGLALAPPPYGIDFVDRQVEQENNTGLPDQLKVGIENLSGLAMDDVRVHYNSSKPAQLQALAYTQGTEIYVGPGQERHLPHEAWHVVQQMQGRVKPTLQMKDGVPVNDDKELEYEADVMGAKALQMHRAAQATNIPKMTASEHQCAVQRKIGELTNVIFGLSGRNAETIQAAVDAGYTTFDGADSYDGTIDFLVAAIEKAKEKGKVRSDFEVIYKVDRTVPEQLEEHLRAVARKLGGYIDHVLIHKVTDTTQSAKYDPILTALKNEKLINMVGAGDVQANMDAQINQKDSFEIDANDLFLAPETETLVEKLNKSGKPVFVYNIVGTLKNLLGLEPDVMPTQQQIIAMVMKIKGIVNKAEPILSSKTQEKVAQNLKIHEPEDEDYPQIEKAYKDIEENITAKNPSVRISEMLPDVKRRVLEILLKRGYNWEKENLFEEESAYETARNEELCRFTPNELTVHYRGGTKTLTLRQLISMLFDSTGNCHRVEAYNFIMET